MNRDEIGQRVARRRQELGLDVADVARLARVDRKTHVSLERGDRWPRDSSRTKIETALQWAPGALDRLARDMDPVPLEQPEPANDATNVNEVQSKFMHPSRRAALIDAAGEEEMRDLLERISSGKVDEETVERANDLLLQINVARLPMWINELSAERKARVVEHVLDLMEEQLVEGSKADDMEATSPEGASSPGDNQNSRAADGRDNDKTLNGPNQGSGTDEAQSDYDLARRQGDGPSLGRRIRDQHDATAEAPDGPGPEDGA